MTRIWDFMKMIFSSRNVSLKFNLKVKQSKVWMALNSLTKIASNYHLINTHSVMIEVGNTCE